MPQRILQQAVPVFQKVKQPDFTQKNTKHYREVGWEKILKGENSYCLLHGPTQDILPDRKA